VNEECFDKAEPKLLFTDAVSVLKEISTLSIDIRIEAFGDNDESNNAPIDQFEISTSSFELDLTKKLGMVVNTVGEVTRVVGDGQAVAAGVSVGCKLVRIGGRRIRTLDELKAEMTELKAAGIR
jgi:predicted metalloprotease with PDZ domain